MTIATRARKSPASMAEVDLPTISAAVTEVANAFAPHYPSTVVSIRYYDPQTGRTFTLAFSDLSLAAVELHCDEAERNGYVPCQSRDTPGADAYAPAQSADLRAETPRADRRVGQRTRQPRSDGLRLPFALKGEYKGMLLSEIEDEDPDAIDWLAQNAYMADIKKGAQKIVNQREQREGLPF